MFFLKILDDLAMKHLWLNYLFFFDIAWYWPHYDTEQSWQNAFCRSNGHTPAFVPQVSLEHSPADLFTWYLCLCLHSWYNSWAEELRQGPSGQQSLKYLLSGPL